MQNLYSPHSMQPNHFNNFGIILFCAFSLLSCSGAQKKPDKTVSIASKQEALRSLRSTIKPATTAVVVSSNEIDWHVGNLPWDRFTLPVISPDGLHAAVQLGPAVPSQILSGTDTSSVNHTVIELHHIDPVHGDTMEPIVVKQQGLLLGRNANNVALLVQAPRGSAGRWIGRVDWATGQLRWLVSDDSTNAFPALNQRGDLAWSRQPKGDHRYHLVVKTSNGERTIDDGDSDWLVPSFSDNNTLFVFRLHDGTLSLVALDLQARDPLLTAATLTLMQSGATREQAWQIATTNPANPLGALAFYHPVHHRMTLWQPGNAMETTYFVQDSVAAAPVKDGSWIVTTSDRVIRQQLGSNDGIHLRDLLAVPIAPTSSQWTHLMLVPDGNRLEVRAINVE